MVSGINSIPPARLVKADEEMLTAIVLGKFEVATKTFPLAEVAAHWSDLDSAARTVFTTELGTP